MTRRFADTGKVGFEYPATDPFGRLGYYGVSECLYSGFSMLVHPSGNPIIISTSPGSKERPNNFQNLSDSGRLLRLAVASECFPERQSLAVGRGNSKDAISSVRETKIMTR